MAPEKWSASRSPWPLTEGAIADQSPRVKPRTGLVVPVSNHMPKRRGRFRRRGADALCCAEIAESCPKTGPCCSGLPRTQGEGNACASQVTPTACNMVFPEGGDPTNEYCVWLGGRCMQGSSSDCRETSEPSSFYGEVEGFERQCTTGSCPGFAAAFKRYAVAHERATMDAVPPEGMTHARLMVISDHWRNVGMGFMPGHVANTMVMALATGIYVYFDNYGRYDWTRYFYGQYGLDMRWTPARQRLWSSRFSALGVKKQVVQVLVEEGPQVSSLPSHPPMLARRLRGPARPPPPPRVAARARSPSA